ncbi:MAG: 4a-hydroxytetrahydrobiopterin dehydratase [Steroidobacteraceae bacterium]|nr:4a-hydroxytetrahydrobiopterin dehydratase [Steroidobacteraceae bacterium]
MTQLTEKKCVPCEGGVPALSRAECEALMPQLAHGWTLAPDARRIERAFGFKDFYRTMSFVNAVAHVASIEDHHPDLEVGYDYCRVRYSTHAISGLSENDFICAAKIDRIDR